MRKPLGVILWLALLGSVSSEEADPAVSVISWKGSAYEDGDAFNVTATFGDKDAQLVWDGFASPEFDFMDEKAKPRIRKEFLFADESTVKALRLIADQAEQYDAGFSGVIGQGVSVKAKIQSPQGKVPREIHYFATPSYKTKAGHFERIPWDLKKMLVDPKVEKEVPPTNRFSQDLRTFADHLDTYQKALNALSEAYKAGGELPLGEVGKVWSPISMESYLAIDQKAVEDAGTIKKGLPVFEAVLAACLAPANRALLCGEDAGGGGVILNITKCNSGRWVEHPLLKMKVSAPECPVGMLSYEAKAFLLHFLIGFRTHEGLDVSDTCQLVLSKEGKLQIRQSDQGFSDSPEIAARLKYLNEKNLCGALLGLKASPEKPVAIVTIPAISLNPENEDQAKIDFLLDGKEQVLEVNRTEGEWKPGRLRDKDDYYLIDGVFHNDTDFRPEGR